MNSIRTICSLILLFLLITFNAFSQNAPKNRLRFNLNQEEDRFVQFFFNSQFWLRYLETNPGTLSGGEVTDHLADVSIRRLRVGAIGKVTDRIGFVAILGANNINYNNSFGNSLEILDLSADYKVAKFLSLGVGKTSWNGLSRYSSPPSTLSILNLDIPVFALPTVNATDYLGRKLSLYAKGQVGAFDYRLTASNPVPVEKQSGKTPTCEDNSSFAPDATPIRTSGYFKYQFKDRESQLHPFTAGTYLGSKRVLNLGVGFDYHPNSMWHMDELQQEQRTDMLLWSVDVFYDVPLQNLSAITIYGAYYNYDFGPGFIRNVGVNNPAGGYDETQGSFNGPGNSYPMIGSGSIVFSQMGYLIPKKLLAADRPVRCQLTGGIQYANFDRLDDAMWHYSFGMNWLVGDFTKLTLGYERRPIFDYGGIDQKLLTNTENKNAVVLQLQFSIK